MKTQVQAYRVDSESGAAQVMSFWLHAVATPLDDYDLTLSMAHLRRIAARIIAGLE